MEKNLRILSTDNTPFQDRFEAGRLLADELKEYEGKKAAVLGIPRGGVVIAREIAHRIKGDLDLVLAHKLGAPGNPELAVGAVVEGGKIFLDPAVESALGIGEDYIRQESRNQFEVIKTRSGQYRHILEKTPLKNRIVIITDDGAARGLTMQAALWAARAEKPKKLICALPVAPVSAVGVMAKYADEVICLRCPEEFYALGQFYLDFQQVEDEDILNMLSAEANQRRKAG